MSKNGKGRANGRQTIGRSTYLNVAAAFNQHILTSCRAMRRRAALTVRAGQQMLRYITTDQIPLACVPDPIRNAIKTRSQAMKAKREEKQR